MTGTRAKAVAPADAVVRPPSRRLPAGAVDAHFHILGPEHAYPYAARRLYTPPDASLDAYRHLAETLGIAGAVIVQPSVYGSDNRRTLDAMAALGMPMRAVVVVDEDVPDGELERLHALGARGVRINTVFSAEAGFAAARRLAERIRPLGWHIQFLTDISAVGDLPALVGPLGLPVVFDHLGHFDAGLGTDWRGFADLVGLMADGRAWVKLSGAYRTTCRQRLPYDDVRPIAEALIARAPGQLLWGSDWPHPSIPVPMPNDGPLLDMMLDWIGDGDIIETICVRTPRAFYGFDTSPRAEGGRA